MKTNDRTFSKLRERLQIMDNIRRKKVFWSSFVCIAILFIMSGCSEKEKVREKEHSNPDSEYQFVPEFYRWNPDGAEQPESIVLEAFDLAARDYYLQPTLDGGCFVVYGYVSVSASKGQGEGEGDFGEQCYLVKYDEKGTEQSRKKITELVEGFVVNQVAVDGEGHLFIRGLDAILAFEADGTFVRKILSLEERPECLSSDNKGNVYCKLLSADYQSCSVRKVGFQEGLSEALAQGGRSGNGFAAYQETGYISSYNSNMYLYDQESQSQEILFSWMGCDIDVEQVRWFGSLSDGRIVVYLLDKTSDGGGELAVLQKKKAQEIPQRKTITLGTFSASSSLRRNVARFNRQNQDYRIEVKEYYDPLLDPGAGGSGQEEAKTALHLDIVSGRCPDILNIEYEDLENYAQKGLLMDLSPFLQDSAVLDIMPNVTEAYTFDGKLVSLPAALQIRTVTGLVKDAGERKGFRLEEMMDFVESHPDSTVFNMNARELLEFCLTFNLVHFVDRENACCSFESDAFLQLLNFCSRCGEQKGNLGDSIWSVYYNPDTMLYEVVINQAVDVTLLIQMFGSDEISFIGYPTSDGSAGHLMEARGGSYSIYAESPYSEIAWLFMETLLTDVQKYSIYNQASGFPVDRKTREEYFTLAMEHPYDELLVTRDTGTETVVTDERRYNITGIGGLLYYIPLPEEVEPILKLIDTATIAQDYDRQIMVIIEEEAETFFSGQKTAQEAARIIQARVSLYLEEQR